MPADRKPLAELELSATTSNLNRAKKLREEEAKAELSAEQKSEVEKLDGLIAQAMKACRRGQTVDGKRNPAFANLESLVKVRTLILKRPGTGKKSTADILRDAKNLFKSGVN